MPTRTLSRTLTVKAVQFNPDDTPWHRSVIRITHDGKIREDWPAIYGCIIPINNFVPIKPGDWIIVDDLGNAKGVETNYNVGPTGTHFWKIVE